MTVLPAKTQISRGIRPVWSESSLCTQWVAKDPSFLHADSEDSDQTGRMPRLIIRPVWSESSLGAHAILSVLSWGQLFHKILSILKFPHQSRAMTLLKMNEKYCSIIQICILSISMHIQNLNKIHKLIHKILNISKILTSIKGHNSVKNWPKITCPGWSSAQSDPSLRWAHMPFCRFCHEANYFTRYWAFWNFHINQGPWHCWKWTKNIVQSSKSASCQYQCIYKIWTKSTN